MVESPQRQPFCFHFSCLVWQVKDTGRKLGDVASLEENHLTVLKIPMEDLVCLVIIH